MILGKTIRSAVLLGLLFSAARSASAQTNYYWDPSGTHSSNGGGNGTWDTGRSTNWWVSGATDSQWTDTTGTDVAIFGGTAGTVNVSGNNTANGLTFSTAGYTLSNGTVTMAGSSPTITMNAPSTIGSLLVVGTDGATFGGTTSVTITQPFFPVSTSSNPGPVQITSGTVTVIGNTTQYPPYPAPVPLCGSVTIGAYSAINLSAGAVLQTANTINLLTAQEPNGHAEDITGQGTIQLVGTASSYANPDINFQPDFQGNSFDGVLIGSQQDILNGSIGLTLNLGNRQRYIVGNTGHNSVSDYYGSSTAPDCQIIANIIGSGGINYYANEQYGGLWPELVLSGSNSFTGPVEVDRGAIFLDNAFALSQSNTFTLSNSDSAGVSYSRLFLFGNNATITNLQSIGTAANIGIANGNPVMTVGSQNATSVNPATLTVNETANTTFAGIITDTLSDFHDGGSLVPGPLSLTKVGTATLTLTNSGNGYTGATTVSAGVLSIGKLSLGGVTSSIGASTNDPANLVLGGGILQYTGTGDTTDRLFTLDAGGGGIDSSGTGPLNWTNTGEIAFGSNPAPSGTRTLTLTGNNTGLNTLSAMILDDSAGFTTAVTKTGPGTWVISASNSYTGPTSVQQGVLQFAASSGLAGALVVNGGTATTADSFAAKSATVQQGLLQIAGGDTLSGPLAVSGGNAILNGRLTATAATVLNGSLQLFGGSSLQSPLALSGGTLSVNNTAAGPTQTTTLSNGLTVGAASTLNLQAGASWNPSVAMIGGTGSFTVNSAATINVASYGCLAVGDYPLMDLTGGTINGSMGFSGLTLGTLPPRVQAKLVANNQGGAEILDLDVTAVDTIKWSGAVNNTWDTTTANWALVSNSASTTYIQGDTVTFDDSAKTGTVSLPSLVQPNSVTVNNDALNYTLSSSTGTGGISGSAPLIKSGSGSLTLLTNNSYTGGTVINGGALILGDGATAGAGSITGDVSLNSNSSVLQFNRPDTLTFPGSITGSGSLVQAGPGTTILTGSNSYSGSTTVSNGTLQIGNGGVSGSIPINNIVNNAGLIFDTNKTVTLVNTISGSGTTYINGGTLQLGDGTNVGSISGSVVTNSTLALALPGSSVTYSGVISGGSGGIALATSVVGNQTLVLTASNGYTGPTYIGGGDLIFSNVANIGSPSGTGNLILDVGTAEYKGSSGTSAHGLTVGPGGATVQVDSATQTLGLLGPASGSGSLTLPGPGSLTTGSVSLFSGSAASPSMLQINGGTLTAIGTPVQFSAGGVGSVSAAGYSPIDIASGAVLRTANTLNLLAYQYKTAVNHSVDLTGSGTLQLVGTNSSTANPDIFFGPDHIGNAYNGVAIDFGLTIDLGNTQRYINGNTGHNSVSNYYNSGNSIDAWMGANIIGGSNAGITFTAITPVSNLYSELVLSGSDTFGGPLVVNQGSVFLDNPFALSQSNSVTLSNSSTDSLSVSHLFLFGNNVTISNLQSGGTFPGRAGIANGNPTMSQSNPNMNGVIGPVTLTVRQTTNTTYAGQIADVLTDHYDGGGIIPGSLSLFKTGPAALVLSGSNTYSGGTEVGAGPLVITSASAFPASTPLTIDAGASFVFNPSGAASIVSSAPAVAAVPEPSTVVLLGVGALAAGLATWRRRTARRCSSQM